MGHLTRNQRYVIETLLNEGRKYKYIASRLNVVESTVSREVKKYRDQRNGKYDADLAHRKAHKKKKDKKRFTRWTSEITCYVTTGLSNNWSPAQIVGYAKREGIPCVSHESIYKFIYADQAKGGTLHLSLRTKRHYRQNRSKTYNYRGVIPERRDIDERPNIVDERSRIGDLEIDLVIGAKQSGALLTVVDRATGMARIELLKGKSAEEVTTAIKTALKSWKPFLNTITSDNGREFTYHKQVAKYLQIDYFFAKPYHSWERGSNENFNGLLRQYFPKYKSFENITEEEVKIAENELNNRPRERLSFFSPLDALEHARNNNDTVDIEAMVDSWRIARMAMAG